ncbi:hypothetical protein [Paraburkholderia sp. J10-1]|uniref:hypothetical protein n=1 Tax=Paraburkholderia sp. J10-1 TaxID=2805430 RepID=UPI002AB7CB80|nr:hypothetical protein [Paraburkholderia sp. J10-1]
MKVNLPQTHIAAGNAARGNSAPAKDSFQQTLCGMERDMWPGAKAGDLPCVPAERIASALPASRVGSDLWHSHFAPAASSHQTPAMAAQRQSLSYRLEPAGVVDDLDTATLSHARADGATAVPVDGSPAVAPAMATHVEPFTPAHGIESGDAHACISSDAAARVAGSPATQTSSSATLLSGEAGLSLVMRINAPSQQERDIVSRLALDTLRRQGVRPARVLVNGVEHFKHEGQPQIRITIMGEQHGN